MNFDKEIMAKKIKLQEMAMEMKKVVDSFVDEVNKKFPDDQTSTPINRNLFKKINSNDFYYKMVDFDGEVIIRGCKVYEKDEYISLYDLIDDIAEYEKYIFDPIDDETTKSSSRIRLAEHTTSSNAYIIKFDMDSQISIILNGLKDINMFINYNKCPYIQDLLYIIKLILMHNKDHSKIDLRSVSNRIEIITNLYNLIERRIRLVLYGIFKHGFFVSFYEDYAVIDENPVIINEEIILKDDYALFFNAESNIRVNYRSLDYIIQEFRRCMEKGYFSNIRTRSKIIEILTPRFHETDEYEVIDVEFQDGSTFVIRKSDSKFFKMFLSYMFLRDIDIYYSYNFKTEFNSRKTNDFELEINPVYSVIDDDSYDSIIEYINDKSSEENKNRINKILKMIDALEERIIKSD
jgi:hypothetical protein